MAITISVQDLWKKYSTNWALQGVNLAVEKGKIVGLFGENGSGKSTMLRTIAGITIPSQGRIEIDGMAVGINTRAKVAYLPEVNSLYSRMKIGELFSFLANIYDSWDWEKSRRLLEFMGLRINQKVGILSKGQKLRLGIICTFSRSSEVVLLDEPFAAIDPVSRRQIIDLLVNEIRTGNQTILISTHILSELEEIFDQVVYLHKGKILLQGEINQLREEYSQNLTDIFAYILESEQESC